MAPITRTRRKVIDRESAETQRLLAKIIVIVPEGYLVVAVGLGHAQQLVEISSSVLKSASPVFSVMLGPSFKEGQTTHTAKNPLRLSDDDPTTTLNLFYVLHSRREKVTRKAEWLQHLVMLCDKYDCVSSIKNFVHLNMRDADLTHVEHFVLAGLIGETEVFEQRAYEVVRMSEEKFMKGISDAVLHLLPNHMLRELTHHKYFRYH